MPPCLLLTFITRSFSTASLVCHSIDAITKKFTSLAGEKYFRIISLADGTMKTERDFSVHQLPTNGHIRNYCFRAQVCVKCSGSHHHSKSQIPEESKPKCENCEQEHTSNYLACPLAQQQQPNIY